MKYDSVISINQHEISIQSPTYFIADIAANHDGELSRAKELIWLAKEAGADAAKFQHFKAEKIVSDYGFKKLSGQMSHQALWEKSVYEVYKQYELNRQWNEELISTAKSAGIDFLTTPYDTEAISMLDVYLPAYKIGSGDITWTQFIGEIARKDKPVLLATGAASMEDVERAVETVLNYNQKIVLMQCNTNYTGSIDNFKHINLKVLETYKIRYPNMVLGLSDHSSGHSTVLGAIALGARVIEKHFTDDNKRIGPDHSFAMNPYTWREMIDRSRELETALGTGIKQVEKNEQETIVVQRRCLRLKVEKRAGDLISESDLECLRPAPLGALEPYRLRTVIGRKLTVGKQAGDALYLADLEE